MVRILAVSDLHGSSRGLGAALAMVEAHSPDILVICGDLTDFGATAWKGNLLDRFPIPVLAVNGNCDTQDVEDALFSDEKRGLMNRAAELKGLKFFGLAYPPDRSLAVPEGTDVLVSHVPPRGCNDSLRIGHIGEEWLRDAVLGLAPKVLLSGHIHESRGMCGLGGTVCVNPGPAKAGFGALVTVSDRVRAELLEA